MEFIKQLVKKAGAFVSDLIGVEPKIAYIILAGVSFLLLALVIVLLVVIIKKAKKSKSSKKIDKAIEELQVEPSEEVVVVTEDQIEEPKLAQDDLTAQINQEKAVKIEEKQPEVVEKKATPTEKKTATKPKTASTKKATAKPEVKKEETKPQRKAVGKWVIEIKRDNEYLAKLLASNGEVMLHSEIYSSPEGARNGINTIKNGVANGKFIVYRDKTKDYYFKLKSANNKLLCAGEIYSTKDGCLSAVESVKRIAETAIIVDGVEKGHRFIDYTPIELSDKALQGAKGKWKIEQGENGGYLARLYANNGQLMLATEEVSKKATATTAVENVKKYAKEGNFVIDKDKFGNFYYKLRNSQKSVVCIGETYDKLESCISALESVRRFALNSELK